MYKKLSLCIVLFTIALSNVSAQSYPFSLPANMEASIDVNTASKETYNNLLLGTNIHGFSTAEEKELINDYDPGTIRFPHGLWANWYDWRRDVSRVYGEENFDYKHGTNGTLKSTEVGMLSSLKIFDNGNIKIGIDGLTALNTARKAAKGKGYDIMWTFNMSADGTDFTNGSPETMARYNDLITRGLEVKAIELGNECFYPGQRSSIIPNAEEYIARAKSMSAALKAADPNIKVSVPLLRRSSWANPNWNVDLTQDQSYYDAVTIHTYVGSDPDNAANSDEAYGTSLTARKHLASSVMEFPMKVAPSKPIWLTEWGVKSGGPNAVSALGMVDCYLYMSENQDIYERANWFSVNGKLNSFLIWESYTASNGATRDKIKYPLQKTSYGSAYQIIRSVLEDSELYESTVNVANLVDGVKAVNARVVTKNGETIVFVVNLTDKEVPFTINMDGAAYSGEYVHKAMSFSAMDEEKTIAFEEDPLSLVNEGSGQITLPKFSISTITLSATTPNLEFENLNNNQEIDRGANLEVKANVGDEFKEVALWVNQTEIGTLTQAPYTWNAHALLTNMTDPQYTLKLVGKNAQNEIAERSITIKTASQWAYTTDNKPHTVPGIIQFEEYDNGGQDKAFYDKSEQNTTNFSYRGTDKVDLSLDGTKVVEVKWQEWLEYTIDVSVTGYYALHINHATRRSPEFEALSVGFPDEEISLYTGFVGTHTGANIYTTNILDEVLLEKGTHVLRFDFLGHGHDLDYFEWEYTQGVSKVSFINENNTQVVSTATNSSCVLPTPPVSDNYVFVGWKTAGGAAFNEQTIVTEDIKVYASWEIKKLAVSVTAENGTVSTNPEQNLYDINSTITLTATPSEGYQFASWTGDYTGNNSTANITVASAMSITANFVVIPKIYTVTFQNGDAITTQDTNTDYTCTLPTAPTKADYIFLGWYTDGGISFNNQTIVSEDMTVTAKWQILEYALNLIAVNGTAVANPNQLMHDKNSLVTITATPDAGYQFSSWSGGYTGTDNPATVTITKAMNVTANFTVRTSITTEDINLIQIFPNPSNGIFTIKTGMQHEAQYRIFNIIGSEVQAGTFVSEATVEIENKEQGVYLLEVISNQKRTIQKIVIRP